MDADLTIRARSRLGLVLRGKYRLDGVLGVGGMAAVYSATHRNGSRVALKMLHPELAMNADIRTRFLREGYAANAVEHRGVVWVLDDDVAEDGSAFVVMELLEGASLEVYRDANGGRLPLEIVLAAGDQLLDVLESAHARGIVHRDIKPDNLFVTRDGALKILDFGIARLRDGALSATRTGAMLGTPAFMAPEQALARNAEVDARTDLYAVGATLFTLLTGHFVHEGENVNELMVYAATRHARSLSTLVSVAPEVAHLVDGALKISRADRWESAGAMRLALRDAHQAVFGSGLTGSPLADIGASRVSRLPGSFPARTRGLAPTPPPEQSARTAPPTARTPPPPPPKNASLVQPRRAVRALFTAGGVVAALIVIVALRPRSRHTAAGAADIDMPQVSVLSGSVSPAGGPFPSTASLDANSDLHDAGLTTATAPPTKPVHAPPQVAVKTLPSPPAASATSRRAARPSPSLPDAAVPRAAPSALGNPFASQ